MIWNVIKKDSSKLAQEKFYRDCKQELAVEADHKCVYCCLHENRFGGIRNFHVEHYKPKSKFKNLINTYSNLFYSCSICNCFKGNDWPCEPTEIFDKPFYPNPLEVNYFDYIEISEDDGSLNGHNTTIKYLIEKLYLNRPQLKNERKLYFLSEKLKASLETLKKIQSHLSSLNSSKKNEVFDLYLEATTLQTSIQDLQLKFMSISFYTQEDITR